MKEIITYIFRKPDPKYKSIEGVFGHLEAHLSAQHKTSTLKLQHSGGGLRALWLNLKQFQKAENNLYHITGDVHYMAIVTGKQSVLTIHDVKSIAKGTFLKSIYLKLFWFWLPALCVKRMTVISQFTRVELENIVPFAKHKIRVVQNPVNEVFQHTEYTFNTEKPRLLLLGTKPNKNVERVLESLKDIHCTVMLVGKPTQQQQELINTLGINLSFKFDLSLEQIVEAYKTCDLLCFASTYEGFGMPIIEAQASGRPVLTSNIGAMKEVAGDAAVLVDPYDVLSIRAGIKNLIEDSGLRSHLIKKGLQNVERFSADTIAKKYMDVYAEVSARD